MNIEKNESQNNFDIRLYVAYWKTKVKKNWHSPSWWISKNERNFDFSFSIFIMMANVKKFLTFVFRYSSWWRISKFFWLSFFNIQHIVECHFFLLSLFDIHQDGKCQIFFFFFAFHFSIFEFEYRKAKIKLNYCCCASFSISIISVQIFKLTA